MTALSNGNYVVASPSWSSAKGAATWGNGTAGVNGAVTSANSLVGSTANDNVGGGGVTALSNGNYVVASPSWSSAKGAATWGNGSAGVNGAVTSSNSLVGSTANDNVGGGGVTALSNGNYVVASPSWDNGANTDAGAVTWGSGTASVNGTVTSSNSLVGSTSSDKIGLSGVTSLSNGNYLVSSGNWNNGTVATAGAVTLANGLASTSGIVSGLNSLIGPFSSNTPTLNLVTNGYMLAMKSLSVIVMNPLLLSTTSLANSANPSTYGSVTFTATVTSGATGTVTFKDGFTTLGTGTISGTTATYSTSAISTGSHSITAVYGGDINYNASTSSVFNLNVNGIIQNGYLIQGNAGSYKLPLDGNTAFTAASVTAGTLPSGLSLSSAGVISGTPAAGTQGNYSLTFHVTPSSGTAYDQPILLTVLPNQFVDPNFSAGDGFGSSIVVLTGGNVVVTAPYDDAGGTDAGAVYLFNGTTGALISTLIGSHANDYVGINGVTALSNGNFVVVSRNWDNGANTDAGAATWGDGTTGVSGVVSSSNSLVGSSSNDKVGSGGVTALSNGNYVVVSQYCSNGSVPLAGAVTWGNGTVGIIGVVSSSNSLVGTTGSGKDGDQVGDYGVTPLSNGNYVVLSPDWSNKLGAVTWGSGTAGVTGVVSSSNSLVGSTANDKVGSGGVTALSNGNFVIRSSQWSSSTGAVTWGSGTAGVSGVLSSSNSLVGSTANDKVGEGGVTALSNGNYVVVSQYCSNGPVQLAGAVTWGNGTVGIRGVVSSSNSLVGTTGSAKDGDQVGDLGVTPLSNGNYVVLSPHWSNELGAVTWGSGTAGIAGNVSSDNSLIGSIGNSNIGQSDGADIVGSGGVTALSNGNYVIRSSQWSASTGAVTWGSGTAGVSGVLSSSNSLVGSTANDKVGAGGVTALSNGNYVVVSQYCSNGSVPLAGAVTWGNGTVGIIGVVSSSNSLVGTTGSGKDGDQVGDYGVTPLSNGNYVVLSPDWSNKLGAVTWGSGTAGVTGVVSSLNSLVGTTGSSQNGDKVGSGGVTALSNGNFVIRSSQWSSSTGAVTWGSGTAGVSGVLSSSNSLVGSTANDKVGEGGVTALSNGNYVVNSPSWSSYKGAVTWGNGAGGVNGAIASSNSLVGSTANDKVGQGGVTALSNGKYLVCSSQWQNGTVANAGAVTLGNALISTSGVVSGLNSLIGPFVSNTPIINMVTTKYMLAMRSPGLLATGLFSTPSTTSLSSSVTSTIFGDNVTFTATVNSGATGTVTFNEGSTILGTGTISGTTATFTTSALSVGSHRITAVYGGDNNYGTSTSNAMSQTVNAGSSTTTLASSANPSTYGRSVTFTATVSSGATGTVTFIDGTTTLGTGTISGTKATYSTSALSAGSHNITAVYSGDTYFPSSTSSVVSQTVNLASSTTTLATDAIHYSYGNDYLTFYGTLVAFTATVSSGATGTVTFKDGTTTLGTGTISGTTATYSTAALSAGSHNITAVYGGDTNFATSTSAAINLLVFGNSTTTTLASSANPGTYGTAVTFTATVTSGATGTVTFKDGSMTLGTGTVSGTTATYTTSALSIGSHSITAVYGGDTNFGTSTSSAVSQTVNAASSTTTLASSANPGNYGGSVTFTATVTSGANGTVTFKDGSTTLGTGTIKIDTNLQSTATYSTSLLSVGSHSIMAVYEGDTNYATSNSSPLSQTVNRVSSTTTLASSLNNCLYGDSVTLTATVTAGATGTVTFMAHNTSSGTDTTLGTRTISGGTATFTSSTIPAALYTITAVYSGDTNYADSTNTSVVLLGISQTTSTTSLASSVNPSTYGNSVTITATVPADATGTVTFYVDKQNFDVAVSAGKAMFTTSALSGGSHDIGAVYSGDTNYLSSFSVMTQTVNRASSTTTLVSPASTITYGDLVTFTATVFSSANGDTVTFYDGTTSLGTGTITSGSATLSTSTLTAGSHSISAVYSGNSNYAGSTSHTISQPVNKANFTTSLTSSASTCWYGDPVTFTATVPGDATGSVTFMDGTTTLGTGTISLSSSGNTATFTTSALTGGSHSITAVYGGDGDYVTSTSSAVTQTVNLAASTTTLVSSANPSTSGGSVTFTATVTSGASGLVTFMEGTATLGTGTINGTTATYSTAALTAGSHIITAVYGGDSNYATSTSSAISQTVNASSTTTTLTSSANPSTYGDSVTFTATVIAGATGTVTFMDGSSTLGTATLSNGTTTFSTTSLAVGSHSITAVYSGDSNYPGSTSSAVSQTVNQAGTTTTLASSTYPSSYGDSVTFTATVTAGATGTVTFKDGTTTLGTGTISGTTATFSTMALTAGSHIITAVYGGDANYTGSTSSTVSQTVNQAGTSTTLASSTYPSSYGDSVTFTATVTAGATGTVTFYEGSSVLGTGTISGTTATFSTMALTAGSHSITAVYGGDANYTGSTSSAVSQTVNQAGTTTSLASSTSTSTYGTSVVFTATVTSGATGTITFMDGTTTLGTGTISGTTATFSTTALTGGNHNITAVYGGDTNYATSTSSIVSQTVNQAGTTTSLASSTSTSTYGTSVALTATVTSGATGTVTFLDGTTTLGTGTISGTTATFSTVAVKAGTHSITAVYGGDANYTGSTSSAVGLTVNPTALTVTANPISKVYDGTTAAYVTYSGWLTGDSVTVNSTSANYGSKYAGTSKAVNINGLTISGADAGNYTLMNTKISTTGSITKATLVVSPVANNKPYDQSTAATISLTDNRIAGDVVTLVYTSATFASKTAGNGKTVTVNGIYITGGVDSGCYNLASNSATTIANITPLTLTGYITASDKVYDGTTAVTLTNRSIASGVLPGDSVGIATCTATFDTKNVSTTKTVTATGFALSGADAANYVMGPQTTSAKITPRAIVGSITVADKVFDASTSGTITSRSLTGVLGSDVVAYVSNPGFEKATFSDKHVGVAKIVSALGLTLSGSDAGNYTVNSGATTTATISPFALTVTASGSRRVYDGTTTATVLLACNSPQGTTLTLSYASASFADKNVGTNKPVSVTGIQISGSDALDYTFNSTTSTTGNITTRALVITATAASKQYDGTTKATVTSLLDNRVTGDAITISYAAAAFASATIGTNIAVTVGIITVTGADKANYSIPTFAYTTANITA